MIRHILFSGLSVPGVSHLLVAPRTDVRRLGMTQAKVDVIPSRNCTLLDSLIKRADPEYLANSV